MMNGIDIKTPLIGRKSKQENGKEKSVDIPKTHLDAIFELHGLVMEEISTAKMDYNGHMNINIEARQAHEEMVAFMEGLEDTTVKPVPVEATSIKEMIDFMQKQTVRSILKYRFKRLYRKMKLHLKIRGDIC